MRYRVITLCLFSLLAASGIQAQVPVRDDEKKKQWQSMENGPWDFAPDWYYYFLHKGYSGAEMYWKWAGRKRERKVSSIKVQKHSKSCCTLSESWEGSRGRPWVCNLHFIKGKKRKK